MNYKIGAFSLLTIVSVLCGGCTKKPRSYSIYFAGGFDGRLVSVKTMNHPLFVGSLVTNDTTGFAGVIRVLHDSKWNLKVESVHDKMSATEIEVLSSKGQNIIVTFSSEDKRFDLRQTDIELQFF